MSKAAELAALIGSQSALSNKNLIINGAMQVAQRGTSSTSVTNGYHTVDRFNFAPVATDELAVTHSQSTTVPSGQGFANSWKLEVTTAETALAADELCIFRQQIEGQNLQHLAYGTSSAKSLTLSFWVRSSLVGKYSCLFFNLDNNRTNLQSFTINTADTWEYKTITIDGDTDSSGSFDNDENGSLQVAWVFAAGTDWTGTPHTGWGAYSQTDDYAFSDQVNFIAQTGTFYITGVQLEIGEQVTPFEHRSYGDELARCQRYYQEIYYRHRYGSSGQAPTGAVYRQTSLSTTMRAAPTVDATSTTTGNAVTITAVTGYTSSMVINATATGAYNNWVTGTLKADAEL